mgnify:FL=1
MISYFRYWQALNKCEESLKTVIAMQPDVPPMVQAQYEMDDMVRQYWKERAENFTKYFLIFIMIVVIMGAAYERGVFNV